MEAKVKARSCGVGRNSVEHGNERRQFVTSTQACVKGLPASSFFCVFYLGGFFEGGGGGGVVFVLINNCRRRYI